MRTRIAFLVVAALFAAFPLVPDLHAQPLVNVETVVVGDPGNAAQQRNGGLVAAGAVSYEFSIGKYEITIGQYTSFLNSVASLSDPYGLYHPTMATDLNSAGIQRLGSLGSFSYEPLGSSSRPVTYVDWFDAARFANWLHNGATNGATTETGSYNLNGASSGIFGRTPTATWVIPSEDEWHKAAFYKGGGTNAGYWLYPTQSDTSPGNAIGGATNQANYNNGVYSVTQSSSYTSAQNYLTDAGAFSNSASAYGTFDQGGNVHEYTDTASGGDRLAIPGGSWGTGEAYMNSFSGYYDNFPTSIGDNIGFRVALVPEPSTYALLLMTGAGALWWSRRKR